LVTNIFSVLGDIVAGVIDLFTTIFSDTGIIAVFWDGTGLTLLGTLLLIGFGFYIVRWAFNYVKNLLRLGSAK